MDIKIKIDKCEHCGGRHTFDMYDIFISDKYHCSCHYDHSHEITVNCPSTNKSIILHKQESW